MKIYWTCPRCKKTEETGPHVPELRHVHDKREYILSPFKKERSKPNKESVKNLKDDAWELFSELVRRSESIDGEMCQCVTCNRIKPWQQMQAGHYIHGTSFIIRELVHPQCAQCNGFGHGMPAEYKEYMIKRYGEKDVERLTFLAKRAKNHVFNVVELKQYIKLFKEKLGEL